MDLRPITDKQKNIYNKLVTHVMQSWEWGEFRKQMGLPVLRYGLFEKGRLKTAFQLTLHNIPLTKKVVGYLPKGPFPDHHLAKALTEISKKHNCAFIKLEPNIEINTTSKKTDNSFKKSLKPMFSKYNFLLDLTKSEDELFKQMHSKTRYNIRVAQKHGVTVEENADEKASDIYLKLYFETTKRQGFTGHNKHYHQTVWKILHASNMARFLIATYKNESLTAWMLFNFKDTLYYTYGGSIQKYKEVMSNNLVCWEAIKLGKRLKLKHFDMWGALGPDADSKDLWYGFHKFKQGYGGRLVKYINTYDLIFDWPVYLIFTAIDKLTPVKVFLLKLLKK